MSGTLHALVRPKGGWSNAERAQFARIERLLADAGLSVEIEHGVTDEGDPWCVFCSAATGEVMIHAARIGRRYVFDSSALPTPIEGASFEHVAERFFDHAALPPQVRRGQGLMIHPSAMLASLILTVVLYVQATAPQAGQPGLDPAEEEGAEEAGKAALLLKLKQIAQQAAEFVASESTGQAAQGQSAPGWAQIVPTGMAAAMVAIAHDLRLVELFAPDHAGVEMPDAAGGAGPETVALSLPVRPAPEAAEAAEAAAEPGGTAEADPDGKAGDGGPGRTPATGEGQVADAAVDAPDAPASQTALPEIASAVLSPLLPGVAGSAGTPPSAAEAAEGTAQEGGPAAEQVAVSFFDGLFEAMSAGGALLGPGGLWSEGGTGGGTPVADTGGEGDGTGTSMADAGGGASDGGDGAAAPSGGGAVAAADSLVITFDTPPDDLPTRTGSAPAAVEALVASLDLTQSMATAFLSADPGAAGLDAGLAGLIERVFDFVEAAADVIIDEGGGDVVIADREVIDVIGESAPRDLALETFSFEDGSRITVIGHEADVDLLVG